VLSVVIPTRDRSATLAAKLPRVLDQEAPPGGFEVVVVDNGSTDGTPQALAAIEKAAGGSLRAVHEPLRGPAAARNSGVSAAKGDLIMFLGDDTEPTDDGLLRAHVALHEARPEPEYAVLGKVVWDEREPVTPLMRWLDTGPQFAYELLSPGRVDVAGYFYTAHVSLKREAFQAVGGFDTRFPYAAVEDMEIGVRLRRHGVTLDYHPELLVVHSHATTLDRWLERMRLVGRSAALLERIHPDDPSPTVSMPTGPLYAGVRFASPLFRRLERPAPAWFQRLRWRVLHHAAYARGYRQGPPESERAVHGEAPGSGASEVDDRYHRRRSVL
jgi:glycosyltransferase involved in cell wall biosynthesis